MAAQRARQGHPPGWPGVVLHQIHAGAQGWVMMNRSLWSVSTIGSAFPTLITPVAWMT